MNHSSFDIVHAGPANLELPALRGGAVERRMIELAAAQARAFGCGVLVYSASRRDRDVEYQGITIRHLATPVALRAREVVFPWRVAKDIQRIKPRVVHLHCRPEFALALGRGPASVLSCDYPFEPFHGRRLLAGVSRAMWKRALNRIDVIAPVSAYCRSVHSDYWHCAPDRYRVLANGVDAGRFRPDPASGSRWREKLGLKNRLVILYVGRACEQKGTDLLQTAWTYWKRRLPQAALVLVGPADRFGNSSGNGILRDLIREGAVHVPPVDDSELPGVYNMADVFLMPTRRLEMFGMASVEAQACGIPVVASDHGGLRETVPDTAGMRFRAGDAADLGSKVTELLTNLELRRRLAGGARAHAARYDWAEIAGLTQELYATAKETHRT
jgi:glycosyltransferase involved in cell wall biosynthesis